MQTLRGENQKPSRNIIKGLSRNNLMLKQVVTKTKEEVSCLRQENRNMMGAIDISLGGS